MRTVPAYVVELFWPQLSEGQRVALAGCGRGLGDSLEVDLEAVAASLGEQAAADLWAHWRRCEEGGGGPEVRIRRTLLRALQRTAKRDRSDLEAELAALDAVPGVGPYVAELTGAVPSRETLAVLGSPFHATLREDEGRLVARLGVDAEIDWLPVLGGPATVGEVRRTFEVTACYATWRDRRVRRLASLVVEAEELWPAPPEGTAVAWRDGAVAVGRL